MQVKFTLQGNLVCLHMSQMVSGTTLCCTEAVLFKDATYGFEKQIGDMLLESDVSPLGTLVLQIGPAVSRVLLGFAVLPYIDQLKQYAAAEGCMLLNSSILWCLLKSCTCFCKSTRWCARNRKRISTEPIPAARRMIRSRIVFMCKTVRLSVCIRFAPSCKCCAAFVVV